MDRQLTWAEMFPYGRHIFYEGNDPNGFVAEIKAKYDFDPSADTGWGVPMPSIEPDFVSYSFDCPSNLLDAIYGSGEYPVGS